MSNQGPDTYLFFFCVKIVVLTGELLHRYEQISHISLKLTPLVTRVKKLQNKRLHLHLVQIGEHLAQQ